MDEQRSNHDALPVSAPLPVSIPLIVIGIFLVLLSLTALGKKERVTVPIRGRGGGFETTEMETGSPGALLLLIPGLSFSVLGVWLIVGKRKFRKQQRLDMLDLDGEPRLTGGEGESRKDEDRA